MSRIYANATGGRARPSISIYDNGEGQLADDFARTFCSLIYGSQEGPYKGAIPFVQGRFNMGGTGVLQFCSEKRKLQLIVSRVPTDVARENNHEWAYTLFCFFPSKQNPSWKYLIDYDGKILTAGNSSLGLLPKAGARSGELCKPRERLVNSGTLIKMYEYQAARSNICGEQFKKLQEYLLRPALPLRMVECREEYKANVMQVTVWDRLSAWGADKLEPGFEEGASITIELDNTEGVPAEVRVFKMRKDADDESDQPYTGLRALINGQSHAKRGAEFFRSKEVDKEHIASSMLVTLDCSSLGQDSKNDLFMSNRETFRDSRLLAELFKKLRKELHDHPALKALNLKRYEEKIANAVDDKQGIEALEELLQTDRDLAEMFGGFSSGRIAAQVANDGPGHTIPGKPELFRGFEFPSFFARADGSTSVAIDLPLGEVARVSFRTDVKNNYFSRRKYRGKCDFVGDFVATHRLFDGRLIFTCSVGNDTLVGTALRTVATITDSHGSGPFALTIEARVVDAPRVMRPREPQEPKEPRIQAGPSRPDVKEVRNGPDAPPITVVRAPQAQHLELHLNVDSKLLDHAKRMRAPEEAMAVEFVFKYGLALAAMGLLDKAKMSDGWLTDEAGCRDRIRDACAGIARVIVPLCLSLPRKLPTAMK
jgi:hypothetical protein